MTDELKQLNFWDTVEAKNSFVKFSEEDNNTVKLHFTGDNPEETVNKFGSKSYDFEVVENERIKTFSVTSMRLLLALKAHLPLNGKHLYIQRIGVGFATNFNVEEVRV